jgi:outer membrane biosynthesis protein TonB
MKRFLIISLTVHVILFLLFTFGNLSFLFPKPDIQQTNTIRIEFLDKLPVNKNLTQTVVPTPKDKPKPKEEIKETTPPPKPDPGIKTKVTAPKPTKKKPEKEEPKKVTAPKEKEKPKKDKVVLKKDKQTPPKKKKEKKVEETAKKNPKPDPKQDKVEKPSPGLEKKKQDIESVDALLNTLLPDVGGKRDENAKELKEQDSSEIPEQLENAIIDAIRSQIQEVWSHTSDDFNFHLLIKVDPSGKVLDVQLSGTEGQSAQQIANAESAYRAAKRLGQFRLDPEIFKLDHYKDGWDELDIDFHP